MYKSWIFYRNSEIIAVHWIKSKRFRLLEAASTYVCEQYSRKPKSFAADEAYRDDKDRDSELDKELRSYTGD